MSTYSGPNIVTSGLVFDLDAGNLKSYPASGNTCIDLQNNYNFTLNASPGFVQSNDGYLTFNGTTQYAYVTGTKKYDSANNFTVGAWINVQNFVGTSTILTHQSSLTANDGWRFKNYGITLYFTLGDVQDYSGSGISLPNWNTWNYVACTVNSNTLTYYINGVPGNSYSISTMYGTPSTFMIGSDFANENESGYIASVQFYNRALSTAEIVQNYNAYRGRYGL